MFGIVSPPEEVAGEDARSPTGTKTTESPPVCPGREKTSTFRSPSQIVSASRYVTSGSTRRASISRSSAVISLRHFRFSVRTQARTFSCAMTPAPCGREDGVSADVVVVVVRVDDPAHRQRREPADLGGELLGGGGRREGVDDEHGVGADHEAGVSQGGRVAFLGDRGVHALPDGHEREVLRRRAARHPARSRKPRARTSAARSGGEADSHARGF